MIFAPERMVRMEMLALSGDVEHIAGLMTGEGSVHIVRQELSPEDDAAGGSGFASRGDEIKGMIGLANELLRWLDLSPADVEMGKRRSFLERSTDEILTEAREALGKLRADISEHFRLRDEAESALVHLDEISEQMNLLHEHGLSFRDLQAFSHFYAVCGTVEQSHAARLAGNLSEASCALSMRPPHGGSAAFLLIGDRDDKERFDGVLADAGAHDRASPERFLRSSEEGLEQVEVELWLQRDRLAELARIFGARCPRWHETLSEWCACLQVHALLDDAMSHLESDGGIAVVSGFVPVSRHASLIRRLEREAEGRYFARFEHVESAGAEKAPTRLCNWRVFRPFELFVKTYGLPGYNDIDPTPFVALSFLAMFGMMFGDVGHGLVLAAIGAGMAFLPYRIFRDMRDLGRIIMMAGFSGAFFGLLFGSVFGIEKDSVLPALWMRPSHPENLTKFLAAALMLGVAIISVGIVVNIVQAFRRRNARKALLGQWSAASLVFFWAMLLLFGLRITGRDVPVSPRVAAGILAVPLCLIVGSQVVHLLVRGKHRNGEAGAAHGTDAGAGSSADAEAEEEVATILFEPIEIVMNLFTNSVSFLRVAAFGLAHAALTMAVFTVNDMVRVPGAGVLSLPFEHLFIVVLEGMIVTIQCLRLEYYEFFSKFFVGNGVVYAPLSVSSEQDPN